MQKKLMKQILTLLILLLECHLSFAQQMVNKELLANSAKIGFRQYIYALEHNNDSIEFAKSNFETYVKALENEHTYKLAEDAWSSWNAINCLSDIYGKTNDPNIKGLTDFVFSYYEYNKRILKTTLLNLNAIEPEYLFVKVEPAITYFAKNKDIHYIERTCNRLENILSKDKYHPFLLAICKYFRTIAYMSVKDMEKAMKYSEIAYDLAKEEEKAYRKTYNYKYFVDISGNYVQGNILKGNYQKAWNVILEVEDGIREAYTENSAQYLALLNTQLDLAMKIGKMTQAKNIVEQMDTLIGKSKLINKQYADNLSNSLNYYKQQLGMTNHIITLQTIQGQFETQMQQAYQDAISGNWTQAKNSYKRILKDFEPTLNEGNILTYSDIISRYIGVLLSTYQYQEALDIIDHADSVVTNLKKYDIYANRYFKEIKGEAYSFLNNYVLAKKNLEEAKKLYELSGDHSTKYYSCLQFLVEVYQKMGDYAFAKLIINEIEAFVNEAYKGKDFSHALCLIQGRLGALNNMLGYKYEAKEQLEKAIANIKDKTAPEMDVFRRTLASYYMIDGNYDKAYEYYSKNYLLSHIDYEINLALKGIVCCMAKKQDPQALLYLKKFNHSTSNNISQTLQHSDKLDLQSYWESTMEDCVEFNNSLLQVFPDNPEMTELAYDNTLYARLGLSEATKPQKTWRNVAKSLQTNEVAIEFILVSEAFYEKHHVRYGALLLRNDYDAPLYIDLCESEEMDSVISNHIITDKNFINKLYDVKNPLIYDLVFKKLTKYLKPKDHIYYCPTNLMNLVNLGYLGDGKQRLSEMYDFHQVSSTALIESLKQKDFSCKGKAAVYGGVSYDESMDEIAEEAKRYQMEKNNANEIENSDANKMMMNLLAQDKSRGALNGFLQGSLEEAMFIEKLFKQNGKDVDLYVGNQASEESLKAYSGKAPQILHISTHGFTFTTVNDQNEHRNIIEDINLIEKKKSTALLYSGLMMAGSDRTWNGENVPQGVEDGILTAYELSQLNLKGCDLTVLSACETGLGHFDATGNEAGLKQALKQAGVGTIIFSLWQVPDVASSMLMQNFYQYILQGKQPREALQEAQTKVAKKFPEPYYWAGFSIID